MGIVFRQSVKSTIIIFIGALLGALINYIYPYIITKAELGVITNIITESTLCQFIFTLGTSVLLSAYISRYPVYDPRRNVLVSFAFIVTIGTAMLLSLPYILLKHHIIGLYQPEDRHYINKFYITIPLLGIIWSFITHFEMYFLSEKKVAIPSFIKEILIRIGTCITIGLYAIKLLSFEGMVWSILVTYGVAASILFFLYRKKKGVGFSTNWNAFTKEEYKDIIKFAWYHLLSGISIYLIGYVDSLLLPALDKSGMASLAVYRIALFIATIMTLPNRAMRNAAFSTLNEAYLQKRHLDLKDIFQRSGVNILIVSVAMLIIIGCNLPNAVAILPKGYEAIAPLVMILMLGNMIDIATGFNSELIGLSVYYKFNFRLSILLLILVVTFDRIFIPIYGVYGAAWSGAASLVIFNIMKYLFLWNKMKIQPFNKNTLLVILAGILTGLTGYFLPHVSNPVTDTIIRTTVITITYGGILVYLKPSEDLITYINSIKKNKRLF